MIQINAAAATAANDGAWHHFAKSKWAQSRLSVSVWL
jgi:hypothetical protein